METNEGRVLIGTVVSENEAKVVLDTRGSGTVTLNRAHVKSIEKLDPDRVRDGEYWFENPQPTRYFFATNALSIPKGEGYYQNTWVLLNNVSYGVSNHFSIGAGTVPIFLFGADALPVWVLPKVSISTAQDNFHLAGGAVLGGVIRDKTSEGGGLVYGTATVGTRDHNASLGVVYGYAGGEFSDTPALNVSGMTRIGKTTYLVSENYFFPGLEGNGVVSAGIRWAPENVAVDFALVRPLGEVSEFTDIPFIGVPWLGVTVPFG